MSNARRTRTTRTPMGESETWTVERIRTLGATTDLRTAAQIFGLSANTAYDLARRGTFPVGVIRAGGQYRVSVPAILAVLGTGTVPADPQPPPDPGPSPPACRARQGPADATVVSPWLDRTDGEPARSGRSGCRGTGPTVAYGGPHGRGDTGDGA